MNAKWNSSYMQLPAHRGLSSPLCLSLPRTSPFPPANLIFNFPYGNAGQPAGRMVATEPVGGSVRKEVSFSRKARMNPGRSGGESRGRMPGQPKSILTISNTRPRSLRQGLFRESNPNPGVRPETVTGTGPNVGHDITNMTWLKETG